MNPEEGETVRPPVRRFRWAGARTGMSLVGFSQVGLFVIAAGYVLHEMKPVLLPLVLAVLVSLILHPVYVAFRKLKLPRMACAALTVAGLFGGLVFGAYQALLPGAEWARTVNQEEMIGKVQAVFKPMKEMSAELKEMAKKVEKATNEAPVGGEDERVPEVVGVVEDAPAAEVEVVAGEGAPVMVEIHEDPVSMLMAETREFGLGVVAFLLLVLFMLAYGNRITRQFNDDERAEAMLERMARDVSRYLFTITLINVGLGVCIGLAMWGLGMPRPVLWGMMGMMLNFIPYVGAVVGTFVVFMAAAVNFDQAGLVLAVPLAYFALTAIEGNVVTPMVLGGRFRINPLVVFVWIFAWAGFWGIAGMLIAMPALVIFKIVCENTEKMGRLRRLLGA